MPARFVDSWDPRIWAASWTPSTDADAPGRKRPGGSAHRPIGYAIAISLLAAGAAVAWLSRPPAAGPSAPVVAGHAPAAAPGHVRRTIVLSGAGDLGDALRSAGVDAATAGKVAAAAAAGLSATGEIRASLILAPSGAGVLLDRLEASNPDSSGVVVSRSASGELTTSRVPRQLSTRIMVRTGTMDGDSFYSSAVAVGIPNSVIPVFAKALAFDFDFQREVSAGDAFEAAYAQAVNASGEAYGAPVLLYASLTTATKSAAVYRFGADAGASEWFDASGRSIVRALMRTPVDGARVTSKFGLRFHPILHFLKLHGGIDFAAPVGTPIYAAGNGVIEFAGPKGPNGNFVKLRHDNGWETLYLHMNRFAAGIATGVRVSQGQQIGEVGTTGRSTGPHLHYEVHINGERVDPLGIDTGTSGKTLQGQQLLAFEKVRDRIDVSRAAQAN